MEIQEAWATSARVILSLDELVMLNNALNEVCHGVPISDREFSTRLGSRRDELQALLCEVGGLIRRLDPAPRSPESP